MCNRLQNFQLGVVVERERDERQTIITHNFHDWPR